MRNRCELLSFFSIFGIQNNSKKKNILLNWVVNFFHFSVSLGYKTTKYFFVMRQFMLWIAFIFQYLWDTKQHHSKEIVYVPSCELLSFFSIFGIQNNKFKQDFWVDRVVNCFHFSVSLGYKTTNGLEYYYESELWIAFIFQYLWDTKQQKCYVYERVLCCELLSFFSIFGIQNNRSNEGQTLR